MGVFRRKKKPVELEEADRDTLGYRIRNWFGALEIRLAVYLNRKTRGLSSRCWLVLLIIFCGLVGGYLVYLLKGIVNSLIT